MDKYRTIKDAVIEEANKRNIKTWELIISEGKSVSASAFRHEIIKEASSFSSSLSLRVIVGNKEGSASTQDLSKDEIPSLFERAYDNALSSDEKDDIVLFAGGLEYPKKESFDYLNYDIKKIKEIALKNHEEVYLKDKRVIDGSTCSAAYGKSIRYYASSNALELFDSNDDAYVMANCKVSDGVDIQNAYSIKEGLIDNVDLTDGVDKAISQLSPKKINSGTYNVVFNQDCMQQILDTFFSVFTGKSSYYGLTRYKCREGEKVASEKVTIIDDPLYPEYRVCSTFDGDGYPCEKKRVIENGVLNTLLYNLEYGTKCNKKSTGNGFRSAINGSAGITSYSFYIKPSENTLEDLFKSSEGGIYITQMKGFHAGANSISGDFSIESAGFIIKDGKAEEAINEFTVSGNFYSLLENVLLVANDLEFDVTLSSQRMGSPSVLVKDLSISGK